MTKHSKWFLLLVVFIAACSSQPVGNEIDTEDRGIKDPLSSLSTRQAGEVDLEENSIRGALWVVQDSDFIAVRGKITYLAKILSDGEGELRMASMDRVNSPRSDTDEDGVFLFEDVPPGHYGLILDVIRQSYLLADPESGEALIIYLEEGEAIDLGILIYDELPFNLE